MYMIWHIHYYSLLQTHEKAQKHETVIMYELTVTKHFSFIDISNMNMQSSKLRYMIIIKSQCSYFGLCL